MTEAKDGTVGQEVLVEDSEVSYAFIVENCSWHPWARFSIGVDLDWRFVLVKICADSGVKVPSGLDALSASSVCEMKTAIVALSRGISHPNGVFLPSSSCEAEEYLEEGLRQDWSGALHHYLSPQQCLNTRSFPPIVRKLIRAGIPGEFREHVWLVLSGGLSMLRTRRAEYPRLASLAASSPFKSLIELDISRTLQDEKEWLSRGCALSASRLLSAYSLRNPNLGYCQGLSYIAGLLVFYMSEECAFAVLCAILEDGLMPPDYYTNLQGAVVDQQVLEYLVQYYLPKLSGILGDEGLAEFSVTAIPWHMCLFAATFSLSGTGRIWDFLLGFGGVVVFRVGMGLLGWVEAELCEKKELKRTNKKKKKNQKTPPSPLSEFSDVSDFKRSSLSSVSAPESDWMSDRSPRSPPCPRSILHTILQKITAVEAASLCEAFPEISENVIQELRENLRKEDGGDGALSVGTAVACHLDEDYFSHPAFSQTPSTAVGGGRRRSSRRSTLYKQVEAFLGK